MPPVFGHGRLRLYLLKLLGDAPRHGYEVIRLLEERFQGLYAPSAGTVYPRLAKLEAEGLVRHAEEGGRKVYSLTLDGERELGAREEELTQLEREIRDSLAALAEEIRENVSGSARDLRQEVRRAAAQATQAATHRAGDRAAWQAPANRLREEARRARRQAREQAKEARQAGQAAGKAGQAGQAGRDGRTRDGHAGQQKEQKEQAGQQSGQEPREAQEAQEAREQFEQAARRIHERVQPHASMGDWPSAVREGLEGLGREIGGFSRFIEHPAAPWGMWPHGAPPAEEEPAEPVDDPQRELLRLLDGLRDEVRDAARDHGVSQEQLREARRHLSTAAAHLVALLRSPTG